MYLNCHTYYSLRFGTFSETDLLALAREMEAGCIALTDINNTSACLNFVRKAPEYDIRPILGIDFRNGVKQEFVALAANNQGYYELNNFLSDHLHREVSFGKKAPEFRDAFVIYPFEKVLEEEMTQFNDREFIGISVADLRKLPFSCYIKNYRDKLVVQQPVTFRNKRDFNAHRLLRAIGNNILLSKLPKSEEASEDERMYPVSNLAMAFREYTFILENTRRLMEACSIDFDFSDTKPMQNQRTYTDSEEDDWKMLQELTEKGLPYRYPEAGPEIRERIEKELTVIRQMNFVSYFLINWDIVSYAKSRGYFHVGRGSGANSVVAYLLGITDVDPMELDLYFERFINLYRTSPPDFDIDFSWRDRQDVTRYIFERFPNVSLLGAYVTFQYRGVVRELGKVFGLPKEEIDRLCEERLVMKDLDQTAQLVMKYGKLIHGMPNYVSIHSSGILISEKPLHYFSATNMPPKGFPTVQFDMHIAEDVGLYKFDILGQRGLAKIKEAIAIIEDNRPDAPLFDIHDIRKLKQDSKINTMVSRAQCMGCFYVESPAMRMLLKKLEVDNYLSLVAASSIIRPGVSKSGMMREYILRHRNPERRKEAHPVMQSIMPDTYGVMVYQEDVIKVAHHFAGLTLGEADVLRRGMSGKYRSREEFKRVEDKFVSNCREKGYDEKLIQEVWHQVASFAGYAFAKGHSASYAVESYQSLFLRAYFPLEYMVAVLNNGGGFYRTEIYVHEARMLGGMIHAPCVNRSLPQHVIRGKDIYLGLLALQELEERTAVRIVRERESDGEYTSLDDFVDRVSIGIEQLSILIRINAFRFTGVDKYELLWHAHFKLGVSKKPELQQRLFRPPHRNFDIPVLTTTDLEAAFDQIELLGFCLCSPFELLKEAPLNDHGAAHLEEFLDRNIDIYGYLITVKRTRTQHGKEMNFATFIDQAGEVFDCTLFPQVAAKYYFRGKGIYRLYGKVVSEFGFLSIEVIKLRKEDYVEDPRYK
ncbi:DNA polymerase III subunit alpha [Robertkochia marina]|uniref:DNA-directed DNA polymerase n=1 Tax=Robertkochia marina TaxID=1227945 RepID=A0A4V3UYB6_9FLAO|nr:DNA polymerase III subunit alpha [Robertkochia marina]THD69048.1 DNA polymerase III subunit alpha [Robertkochia marina]TRZ44871.1 DNA polymerase III subunit alpha [Robertkochia marina]